MNTNEQRIREHAHKLWEPRPGRTVEATSSGSLQKPNANTRR